MTLSVGAMVISFGVIVSASVQQEPARFEKTIEVSRNARLRLNASAGRLIIGIWEKSAVRVVAVPQRGTEIGIDSSPALLAIRGRAARGGVDEAAYEVTVPRGMGVLVDAGDMDIDIAGAEGDVVARNQSGRITLRKGRGSASLTSVLGEIVVDGWSGSVVGRTVHAPVRLTDVAGDVDVESSTNHLYLTRIDSKVVTASTVGGVIWFDGRFDDRGRYEFQTHSGSIVLAVTEPLNAILSVSTVNGAFSSEFPHTGRTGHGEAGSP